ncbi:helix-turn-helix domain-containing protein [Enterococcus sp. HY326]|uniref:helix-turn-helix domain-containing protein n=1 Tax=Enterococcus sp. HY326 TaxID=2971265 RepID=UPI00223EB786|nr:helix-turn-helix transcriptional regulator [Enterococcus sp. HY326]
MIGNVVKEIRLAKGMTQKEVFSGVVSKSFYSDFEAGKSSIETTKFIMLLDNLGISFSEYRYFERTTYENLEEQIDKLYKRGKFEELYEIYLRFKNDISPKKRYAAIHAYLLVLLTRANFYQFSREPFFEIVSEIEAYKSWTLREIKLAKLVLLSLSEKEQEGAASILTRIVEELQKYQLFDEKIYFEEICELYFNHIQSLLVVNNIEAAQIKLIEYQKEAAQSDNLHLLIQESFISNLVSLYLDFPNSQQKLSAFLNNLDQKKSSEFIFYRIIVDIHQEKAKNYYERYSKA